jgi:heterodisulfide reductase subunit C
MILLSLMNALSAKDRAAACYQCAKCSAGCPAAPEMTVLPHRAMHLIALGQEQRLRGENTLWLCAACNTCATRCPNDIDIPGVFDTLRSGWVSASVPCPAPQVLRFHESFVRDLKRRGRVHEVRVMGEYNLAIRDPLHNAPLAVRMLLKGRLRLLPPRRVKGFRRWIKRQCATPRQ